MRRPIHVSPPQDFASYSPSELFRFFFQLGRWTDESFSDDLQAFTRGKLVSTVTISKWKNQDVIPTRYSGPFLNLIESVTKNELSKDWSAAFETVWALQSSGRKQNGSDNQMSDSSDFICLQHQKWIANLYEQPCSGKTFSVSDIYVPLQLYDLNEEELQARDAEKVISDFMQTNDASSNSDWMFISGGPGSGKSMTALHLARSLCEKDIFPIYIRAHQLSDIDIDITDPDKFIVDAFSVGSFLKHFRASSQKTACLFLDGLDNIYRGNREGADRLEKLLDELRLEQTVCAAHGKSLRVVAIGQAAHIRLALKQLKLTEFKHLSILPLTGQLVCENGQCHDLGKDMRPTWWAKYLAAIGERNDPSLPDFLSIDYDDFSEFGASPSLAYLICQTAFAKDEDRQATDLPHERVNALTYSENKNTIYKSVLERAVQDMGGKFSAQSLVSVLQHIAVAHWHKTQGQSLSPEAIYNSLKDAEVRAAFLDLHVTEVTTFGLSGKLSTPLNFEPSSFEDAPPGILMEFAHDSFSEYLTATILFDRFNDLISAFGQEGAFETALKDWARISQAGVHNAGLAGFCQREARLRFDEYSNINWDLALTIIKDHIKPDDFKASGLALISALQRSSNLLFFIWSCLNLERHKHTKSWFQFTDETEPFTSIDLKSIQAPNALSLKSGSLMDPPLRHESFLTASLSGLHLMAADMSQLCFSLGHMDQAIFEDCSFAMTHWSHVKTSKAIFQKSVFPHVSFYRLQALDTEFTDCFLQGSKFQSGIFSSCRLRDTYFSQCHFSELEFANTKLENVIFDRCVFFQSAFGNALTHSANRSVIFRHCTFIDMEAALKSVPKNCIHSPILQTTGG